jgi:ribosomal-protein-alanine N-acetyltransferase
LKINLNPFPELFTERLALRALRPTDAEELLQLRSDKQVNLYLDRPPTTTRVGAEAFIEKITKIVSNNEGAYWAISLKTDQKLIGTICYWNFDTEKEMAEIGYELMPTHQGKGLMQEAIAAAINYGFKEMRLKVIVAVTHPDNAGSSKLLIKNGFVLDAGNEFVSEEEAEGQKVYLLRR